eukprot:m.127291 g.127291  ORF g.127291 m.127291 type:complete len:566 (+) comp16362_c0_seq1:448-2145(+)
MQSQRVLVLVQSRTAASRHRFSTSAASRSSAPSSSVRRVLAQELYAPVMRDTPRDAAIASHQLMLRAGYIRQSSAGIYNLLPLALRSLNKIIRIVDEEMEAIGAHKLALANLTPASLWRQSGRWDTTGPELMKLKDRKEVEYCLSPTHEEAITDLAGSTLQSYQQLPLLLYQLDRKFRDEARPRFGLMRGREFLMKDLYTFDADLPAAKATYERVCTAYSKIFARLGLPIHKVEADTGNIGGDHSHEYHVCSEVGEDALLTCSSCGYAANQEKATGVAPPLARMFEIDASPPAWKTHLIHHYGLAVSLASTEAPQPCTTACLAAMAFKKPDNSVVTVLYRSDRKINEIKMKGCERMRHLPEGFERQTIVIDHSLKANVPTGDYTVAEDKDDCPQCKSKASLTGSRGIELGHAFLLGRKYSQPFATAYTDAHGVHHVTEMGCYGLGITRILASAVELFHDNDGIKWPQAIAPYSLCIVTVPAKNEAGEKLYDTLSSTELKGDIVLDTSDRSMGKKIKDALLLGYPWIAVLGNRYGGKEVELISRHTGKRADVLPEDLLKTILHQQH